jgi:hypothetical protein
MTMSEHDDRREPTLPVTAEVGSEGGSFADPATQVSTFEGDVTRVRGRGGASSTATQGIRLAEIRDAGASAAAGIVRYPTEAPDGPAAPGARTSGIDWKMGIAGAAAGAAVAMVVSRLRGRARERQAGVAASETVVVAVTPPLP